MAACDFFDIEIKGRGGHAAMPDRCVDPIVALGQLITALQSIVGRNVDPLKAGVVSVTQIEGGGSYNVIPDRVALKGTVRTFCSDVREQIQNRIQQLVDGICGSMNCEGELDYRQVFPATVNTAAEASECFSALRVTPGIEETYLNPPPTMGSEDFSFMLERHNGCYIWLGNGSEKNGRTLHSPNYDFNDDILPLGANYWVSLVHRLLQG